MTALEICCGDIESVAAANLGNADRIELCSALSEGGLTPSFGLIKQSISISKIPINVLIRPRAGDFLYTDLEKENMLIDISTAKKLGANGIVIGALNPNGTIDVDFCEEMINSAGKMNITFHRAFDMCADLHRSLLDIIDLGCDTLLTSGLATSAEKGLEQLSHLHALACGKISIMAGSGVNPSNASSLITKGKVDALHASARTIHRSNMQYTNPHVSMGNKEFDEYSILKSDIDTVKQLAHICHEQYT